MAEKKVSVRLVAEGGQTVRAEFEGMGSAGRSAFAQIDEGQKSAEASAKVFMTAIEAQQREYNQLRASISPAFAAQQRYDAAVKTLNDSQRLGIITQAEYRDQIELVGQSYLTAAGQAQQFGRTQQVGAAQTANITAQFNDIGVMLASGQSPFTLAMQQGTQLNQVFAQMGGPRGVLAGVRSGLMSMVSPMSLATIGIIAGGAALVQWGTAALESKEDAKAFQDAIESIDEEITGLNDKLALSRTGLKTVAELNITREIDRLKTERDALLETVATQGASVEGERSGSFNAQQTQREIAALEAKLERLNSIREEIQQEEYAVNRMALAYRTYAATRMESERQIADQRARAYQFYGQTRSESEAQVRTARDILAELKEQARMAALIARYGADSIEVTRARATAEREAIIEKVKAMDVAEDLKKEMMVAFDVSQSLADLNIAGGISAAVDPARQLADYMGITLAAAQRIAALGPQGVPTGDGKVYSGRGGDPRQFGGSAFDILNRQGTAFLAAWKPPKVARGGGGGGGGALKAQNDALREAKRIYEQTRTEAEKYAEAAARLNELHKAGHLDTETFNRAMQDLDETFRSAEYEVITQGIEGISDALARTVVYGDSLREGLAGVFKGIAFDILNSGIKQALTQVFAPTGQTGGGLFGKILGGLFGGGANQAAVGNASVGVPSFAGGGHTGYGPRSGGLDGQGGYLAMVHPRERIVDETRGGAGQNVHVTVGVSADSNGNLMPFVESVSRRNATSATAVGMGAVQKTVGPTAAQYQERYR